MTTPFVGAGVIARLIGADDPRKPRAGAALFQKGERGVLLLRRADDAERDGQAAE